MKKVYMLIAGVMLVVALSSPVIYKTITRQDLDSAAGMLLMLYGVMIFLSELVRSVKCSQVTNIISYLIVSAPLLYMLSNYRNSSDIPFVLGIYAAVTGLSIAILIRNNRVLKSDIA